MVNAMGMISKGMKESAQAKTGQCTSKEASKNKYIVEIRCWVPFEKIVEGRIGPGYEKEDTYKVRVDISSLVVKIEQ